MNEMTVDPSEQLAADFESLNLLGAGCDFLSTNSSLIADPVITGIDSDGSEVFLIDDTKQSVGAFKLRGALAAVEEAHARNVGVVSVASSGSFGMSVAFSAQQYGMQAQVFMPRDAPRRKVDLVERLGGLVDSKAATYEDAKLHAKQASGAFLDGVSSAVFRGNATLAIRSLAILGNRVREPVAIVVPLGIGSLALPTTKVLTELNVEHDLCVVEPKSHAKFAAYRSSDIRPDWTPTLADGAAVRKLPPGFASLLENLVAHNFTITESAIFDAMQDLWKSWRVVSEGAGALAYAAYRANTETLNKYATVLLFVTGSNMDAKVKASVQSHEQ